MKLSFPELEIREKSAADFTSPFECTARCAIRACMVTTNQPTNESTHEPANESTKRILGSMCANVSGAQRKSRNFHGLTPKRQLANGRPRAFLSGSAPQKQFLLTGWKGLRIPNGKSGAVREAGIKDAYRLGIVAHKFAFSHLLVDDMAIQALNCIRTRFARFFGANSLRCECFPAEFASWLSPPRREPSAED